MRTTNIIHVEICYIIVNMGYIQLLESPVYGAREGFH